MPLLEGGTVPQAPLANVRNLVDALARGIARDRLPTQLKLKERHVTYAMTAARVLCLITAEGALSKLGERVAATRAGSKDERELLRQAFQASELGVHFGDLLDPMPVSKAELTGRIVRLTGLSHSTADHRASDLRGWRSFLLMSAWQAPVPLLRREDVPIALSGQLVDRLHTLNPWWTGQPSNLDVSLLERSFVPQIARKLDRSLGVILAIRGPRQVGKSTAVKQLVGRLLSQGVDARRILFVQFDDLPSLKELRRPGGEPILDIVRWYEDNILGGTLNAKARDGQPVYVFLDEAQNVPDWPIQLKFLVDQSRVHVILTGSSALRIQAGEDSLAGRIQTHTVAPLTLREIARFHDLVDVPSVRGNATNVLATRDAWVGAQQAGLQHRQLRDRAFSLFAERGGYPALHHARVRDEPWSELQHELRGSVVQKAIGHDVRSGGSGKGNKRSADVLEAVFRILCRRAGETLSINALAELCGKEGETPALPRLRQYVSWFEGALLVHGVRALELLAKRGSAATKYCIADHGLRASWLGEVLPLTPEDRTGAGGGAQTRSGFLAESVAGSFFASLLHDVHDVRWKPASPGSPEVDFVLLIGDRRVPVEVKYRKTIDASDIEGLQRFVERPDHRAEFGILVTESDDGAAAVADPRIVALPLSSLLLLG